MPCPDARFPDERRDLLVNRLANLGQPLYHQRKFQNYQRLAELISVGREAVERRLANALAVAHGRIETCDRNSAEFPPALPGGLGANRIRISGLCCPSRHGAICKRN